MIVRLGKEQRFDELVFSHYGNLEHLDDVIKLNQIHINKLTLEIGDKVKLPIFAKKSNINNIKSLWD